MSSATVVAPFTGAIAVKCSRALATCVASTLQTQSVIARCVDAAEQCSTSNGMRSEGEGRHTFDARSENVDSTSLAACTGGAMNGSVFRTWSELGCRGKGCQGMFNEQGYSYM